METAMDCYMQDAYVRTCEIKLNIQAKWEFNETLIDILIKKFSEECKN